VCRLRDGKGLQHLAYLLHHPGMKVSCLDMVEGDRRSAKASARHDTSAISRTDVTRNGQAAFERARLTVTKSLKTALEKIRRSNPVLGAHLEATIRRGYFCSYTPDPRLHIAWHG